MFLLSGAAGCSFNSTGAMHLQVPIAVFSYIFTCINDCVWLIYLMLIAKLHVLHSCACGELL